MLSLFAADEGLGGNQARELWIRWGWGWCSLSGWRLDAPHHRLSPGQGP